MVEPWSQSQRLLFIDYQLRWDGRINRADLTRHFDISVPQASLDVARYRELAPENLSYDASARTYVAGPCFRALYPSSGGEHFLRELLASAHGASAPDATYAASVPKLERPVDDAVLAMVHRAVVARIGLRITYQSLSRPSPSERTISPHAFVHDGARWHVRAYCHERTDFRDFVLARVLAVHGPAQVGEAAQHDAAWNELVELILGPNPRLSAGQRRAIEVEYGMVCGEARLSCRRALLFYTLQQLRIGEGAAPESQHLVLKNEREVLRPEVASLGQGIEAT